MLPSDRLSLYLPIDGFGEERAEFEAQHGNSAKLRPLQLEEITFCFGRGMPRELGVFTLTHVSGRVSMSICS